MAYWVFPAHSKSRCVLPQSGGMFHKCHLGWISWYYTVLRSFHLLTEFLSVIPSIIEGHWNIQLVIVNLSISPWNPTSLGFMFLKLSLGASVWRVGPSSWCMHTFVMKLPLATSLDIKSILSDSSQSSFLWISATTVYLFNMLLLLTYCVFIFKLSLLMGMMRVGSAWSPLPFTWDYRLFIFNVLIDWLGLSLPSYCLFSVCPLWWLLPSHRKVVSRSRCGAHLFPQRSLSSVAWCPVSCTFCLFLVISWESKS